MYEIFLIALFSSLSFLYISWILIFFLPKRRLKKRRFHPKLSIILPAHNEEKIIGETIDTIFSSDYPNEKEVIVVNDGSTDNTENIVRKMKKKHPQLRLLNLKHSGKANALNVGMKHTKYDTFVFLDADSSLNKNTLKELVQPLADEKVGIASGIVRAKLTRNPLTWFQDFEYLLSSSWRYVCYVVNSTSVVPGFAAVKRQAMKKIGGFSNDTLTEDFDIVLSSKKAGLKTVMTTSAVIYTSVPNSIKGLFKQRFRWGRGTLQVIRKHSDMIFSVKYGLLGSYTIPTHIYWFIFSLIYFPTVLYWMFADYYTYFFSNSDIISWNVILYFFKWFTTYGMYELIYKTIIGVYPLSPLLLFTITAFTLSSIYTLLIFLKFTKPSFKHAVVYFLLFPYNVLVLFIQSITFLYELSGKGDSSNKWRKNQ